MIKYTDQLNEKNIPIALVFLKALKCGEELKVYGEWMYNVYLTIVRGYVHKSKSKYTCQYTICEAVNC